MKTEQIIEEREDSVKMKMRFKRFLSGFMAVATLASVIIQPVAVSASELEPEEIPFEQQYAELKDVQDSLDPDEIVKANDIELSYGQEFDVEVDLSGIEGVDESKIKILFHEAKNENKKAPKTGDESMPIAYMLTLVGAAVAAIIVLIKRKRTI